MLHQALSERLRGKPRGLTRAGRGAHRGTESPLARRVAAVSDQQRQAAVAVSSALRPAADGRRRQHDHHARCRQPARRDDPVLEIDDAVELHRLGQDDATGLRTRAGDGRQGRASRQAVHQLVGRSGDRHDRHGLRDLRALPDPDHVDPVQQLRDEDRIRRDEGVAREIQDVRHLRQLRRLRQGDGRIRRARDRTGAGGRMRS